MATWRWPRPRSTDARYRVARTGRDHQGTGQRDRLTSKVLRPPPGPTPTTSHAPPSTLLLSPTPPPPPRPPPAAVTCPCFSPAPSPNQPGKPASGTPGDEGPGRASAGHGAS